MQFIPLIKIKNKKINVNEDKLLEEIKKERPAYILDYDGIKKDKPNIEIYQKLSKKIDLLWIDSAPRNLGDIVDIILAGATKITIRQKHWPYIKIPQIKEITENKIYEAVSEKEKIYYKKRLYDIDGYVYFSTKKEINNDFKQKHFLKNYINKKEIYSFESDKKNIDYWKKLGIKGIITDINQIEEFRKK